MLDIATEGRGMGQKIVDGFCLGFGAAFGWSLGMGCISLVISLLGRGHA